MSTEERRSAAAEMANIHGYEPFTNLITEMREVQDLN
jgi:hypothetical protein